MSALVLMMGAEVDNDEGSLMSFDLSELEEMESEDEVLMQVPDTTEYPPLSQQDQVKDARSLPLAKGDPYRFFGDEGSLISFDVGEIDEDEVLLQAPEYPPLSHQDAVREARSVQLDKGDPYRFFDDSKKQEL